MTPAEGPCTSPVPGMTVMVFRARSTRKVLRAEMLPKSTNSVTYLGGGGVRAVSEPGVGERIEIRNPCSWGSHRGLGSRSLRGSYGSLSVGRECRSLAGEWVWPPSGRGLGLRAVVNSGLLPVVIHGVCVCVEGQQESLQARPWDGGS